MPRTFIHFILEPLYKLHTLVLGESTSDLAHALAQLGVRLKPSQLAQDSRPLLRDVLSCFFGVSGSGGANDAIQRRQSPSSAFAGATAAGFADLVTRCLPSPADHARDKVDRCWTGFSGGGGGGGQEINGHNHGDDEAEEAVARLGDVMRRCDANGPLMIHVTKMYNSIDVNGFEAFGRVMSGTVKPGMKVRVLGERYSADDEEDMVLCEVSSVSVFQSRYRISAGETGIPAGNWVLLGGVEGSIVKTATITDLAPTEEAPVHIFRPLRHNSRAVLKVAVEPVNPTELPKMLDGLRKVNRSYSVLETEVEESGEHVILGTGELYLDCVLHDLRKMYAEIEIKVADPVVKFSETVVEVSSLKCYAETPNHKNKITMIAEPLEKGCADDIEAERVDKNWPPRKMGDWFSSKYGWDVLASRNIWGFGPASTGGPNVLVNETLSESEKKTLNTARDNIVQGFQWATKQGPLADERELHFFLNDYITGFF